MIAIAWAALIFWPVVSIIFYRKLNLPVAFCTTLIAGYLLLPTQIGLDLPVLPRLDKFTIPSLCALALTIAALNRRDCTYPVLPGWIPRDPVTLGLFVMLAFGVIGTVLTNNDTLVYGWRVIPGLRPYDALSIFLGLAVMLIPLFLGRKLLASQEGQRVLLLALAISAVVYTFPALWEVRMSPQLHTQLYGFFPQSFAQHIRNGGFRPLVFLNHGLSLSIFLTFAVIAAAGLFRATTGQTRMRWAMATGWLFLVLFMTKSLGAFMIATLLLPVALLLRSRTQLLVASCIAGIVLTYPILRTTELIPIDRVMSFAESVSEARAASLNTRIENEENLLAKARERPVFGWGSWGRNRIFDETGRDISITDGSWIIEIGTGGWFRYIPIFGLLCWPLIGLFIAKRDRIDPICGILALIMAAKLIDFIPNFGMVPVVWLMAGSLLGRLEMKAADLHAGAADASPEPPDDRGIAYARGPAPAGTEPPARPVRYARSFPDPANRRSADAAEPASAPEPRTGPRYARNKPLARR